MPARQSFKISNLPPPPMAVEDDALAEWVRAAYTTISQLSKAVQRIQGNEASNQPSQGTGSNPGGTQTEININALRPDGVIILVDGVIYPLNVEGVNAALQKASSKGGGTVMVPAGANIPVYTTSVKIPNRCALQGFGSFSEVATFVGNAQTNVTAIIENASQDGTQQYAAIRNIQVNGNKGTGAVVGAGILYKDGCYVGSLIEDSLVIACSGNGIRLDGTNFGVGCLDVRNVSVTTCGDDNIIVTGDSSDGIRFYSINSESVATGKACLRITRGSSGTASANHSINGFWCEGLNVADAIVLNEVSGCVVIDAFCDSTAIRNVVKITGTISGSDGAFGSSGHVLINLRRGGSDETAGSPTYIVDDQSSGVTVTGTYTGGGSGSRFVSYYKSPVATAQSGSNTEQMYGIQPQRQGPTTASASTVDLVDGSLFPISGTTQIDNFTNAARFKGKLMVTHHAGALNLAHHSVGTGNLRLDGGVDIVTAADSRFIWYSDGTNWWMIGMAAAAGSGGIYLRRDGGNTVTGAIDWTGQTITNWGGCTSSNATQLNIISNKTAVAGAGINLRWNAAAAVAAGYYPLTVQYDNATGTRDVMKVGYQSTTESVLWLPDKDGGNDAGITEVHIVMGESNDYANTGTVAIRGMPNQFSGAMWFYVGGELAMDIRKSGQLVNFTSGYSFANNGVFKTRAGPNGTDFGSSGSYVFGMTSTLTPAAGLHTAWTRATPADTLTTTDYQYHLATIDYLGQFRSGQHGDFAKAPEDGGFSAAGWYEASNATNQTGADVYYRAGRGTGNSTGKGGIIFQTPDAGASGTAVQSLTTKASITRLGQLYGVSAGSNIGLGQTNAPAAITAGATVTLTVGTDNQVQRYDFDAGGGAYSYNIDLVTTTGAVEGSAFWLFIDKEASANPTINVRNGSGGANIISINNATAQLWGCIFVYDGTAWQRHVAVVNDL